MIKRIARRLDRLRHREARLSFAQEAEDLVLLRHLVVPTNRKSFYVDVGAHDPKWASNTYLLYQSGWNGINIDATQGVVEKFRRQRPRDVSLELAIGDGAEVTFVDFHGHTLSGIDNDRQDSRANDGHTVRSRRRLRTVPLSKVLEDHLPADQTIDLLTVDVEGYEEIVLRSNDWNKFRPRVIMVEIGSVISLAEVISSSIASYLEGLGYIPYAKTGLTVFFADRQRIQTTSLSYEISA